MNYRTIGAILLIAVFGVSPDAWAQEPAVRDARGLLVLYTFERPPGDTIRDRSGTGEPLDLKIETPQRLAWRGGRLNVTASARITSAHPAHKIVAAIKKSNALSIETWVKPQDQRQAGPARIVTLSADPGQRNFTLGQDGSHFDLRLRTTSTNGNGIPSTSTSENSVQTEWTHLVFTRDSAGSVRIYLNGKQVVEGQVTGDLSTWSDDFRLSLANELTGDRPWLGELQLVAIYDRSLSAEDVSRHHRAGVPQSAESAARLPPVAARRVDFVQDIQPILRRHCFECHAAGNEEGGLDLSVRQRALEGGASGPVLVKGDSTISQLVHRVAAVDESEVMPPSGDRLTAEQIGLLRAWIDQGIAWPDGADALDPRLEAARTHWAFQPLHEVPLPEVLDSSWCRTPIDHFILSRLEAAGLHPAAPAAARELLRRVALDVEGLPPAPEQFNAFRVEFERNPDSAYVAFVERLLASRHYGERWGRHWLDVAHYADSDGMESDRDRPNAYHYRDFVIRAFNEDRPFDQFIRWQLAGDEYEPENPDAVAATGFLAAGPHEVLDAKLLEQERLRSRYNELDDMLSTIGTGMLGLTLGCARCHDHKYDAIPTRDYYRLMAALHSGDRAEVALGKDGPKALVYRDLGSQPLPTWLFRRADFYDRRQPVQLGFVSMLTRGRSADDYWNDARREPVNRESTSQRRALAEWITDVDHGAGALLARVIVNRLWQHHFGEALVPSVGDFGVRAAEPSHPELLEWLARDLVQHGWKLKRVHQLMLTSAVYRQSSASDASAADLENRLLGKMRPRRLEAEILRDSMLVASGTLNRQSYGPAFKPPIASEAMLARNLKDAYPSNIQDSPDARRRSVYMFHKRVVPYPLLQAFDKPDAQQSCGRRDRTTVAPQALTLLNDPFVRTVCRDFATRLLKETDSDPSNWIDRAWWLALGRAPSSSELAVSRQFIQEQIDQRTKRGEAASTEEVRLRSLADFCQTLISLNEFLYVD